MSEEVYFKIPREDFERLIEACCKMNGCLHDLNNCKCALSSGLSLPEKLEELQ